MFPASLRTCMNWFGLPGVGRTVSEQGDHRYVYSATIDSVRCGGTAVLQSAMLRVSLGNAKPGAALVTLMVFRVCQCPAVVFGAAT